MPAQFAPLDAVILTVIPCELLAVRTTLGLRDSARIQDEAGTVYYRGVVRSALSGRALEIAVTCIGTAGNSAATAATRDAITRWQPRAVLLVGIAAGVRDRVRLGSVVLSERVVAYEHAAVVARSDATHEESRPEVNRLPHVMAQQLANYEPNSARIIERFERAGGRFPDANADVGDNPAMTIEVTRATIASGDKLPRDTQKQQEIRALHGKIEAFDMESAGFVEACHRDHVPWIVIRGISDFGDAQKADRFQEFAAWVAAAVLRDFLVHGLDLAPASPPHGMRPSSFGTQVPRYADDRARALGEQLQDARRRCEALARADAATEPVNQEILDIKRKLREGGQIRAGDALGERYLLLEAIGRGGFATVWKAIDETAKTTVAIKVLHPDIAGDVVRRDRFFRGARTMATLEHPAVVRVLEPYGDDAGFYYFVMEYVAGVDLRRAVLDGKLDKPQSLALLLRVGEALAVAHARGIVHRDVKPANILLDENNQPKLTDFDLVAVGDTTGGTRTGALGTFVYAAPECLHHPQDADARADVYGLGMTVLFCLHGAELPMDVVRGVQPFLDDIDCTGPLRSLLEQTTAWKKEQRTANAAAFTEALHKAIPDDAISGPTATESPMDILAWFVDERGIGETVWVTDDGNSARVVARTSALVFGAGSRVWTWKPSKRSIQCLDKSVVPERMYPFEWASEGFGEFPIIQGSITNIALKEVTSQIEVLFAGWKQYEESPGWFALNQEIVPLGSVGPYLLVRMDMDSDSLAAHPWHNVEFHVVDLRTGEFIELIQETERDVLIRNEGVKAARTLSYTEVAGLPEELPDVKLTLFTFVYGFDHRLHVRYQFTTDHSYAGSDRRWADYSRSESEYGGTLPETLEPYREAPPLLRRYWEKAPRPADRTGWTAVSRSRETRAVLWRAFDERKDG